MRVKLTAGSGGSDGHEMRVERRGGGHGGPESLMLRFLPLYLISLSGAAAYELPEFDKWNKGYRVRSSYWEPYVGDQDTLGLFHLDREGATSDTEFETDLADAELEDEGKAEAGELESEDSKNSGGSVADSGPQKVNADVVGDVEWLGDGVFGGSLRLKGGSDALVFPPYPDVKGKKPCTVECWLQTGKLAQGGTVFSLDSNKPKHSAVELQCGVDGKLSLTCYGRSLFQLETRVPGEQWSHLALEWAPSPQVTKLAIYLNGKCVDSKEHPKLFEVFEDLTGTIRIGNNAAGTGGLVATIDEARVSSGERLFYAQDLAWADPQARREVVGSRPYLRDRGDLLFHVSFDRTPEADQATGEEHIDYGPKPPPEASIQKMLALRYRPGVRGKALLIGQGRAMPIWPGNGNFNPERGSFELWASPFDWDNRRMQGFQDPMEYVPILRVIDRARKGERDRPRNVLQFGFIHKKPREKLPPPRVEPGRWYHVIGTYENGHCRLFLNGQPMPESAVYMSAAKPPADDGPAPDYSIFLDPIAPNRQYFGQQTLVDELRFYSRPLTPPEAENAYARFLPDTPLKELPFAHTEITMNVPFRQFSVSMELLGKERDTVGATAIRAYGPDGPNPYLNGEVTEFKNGRGALSIKEAAVEYGNHRIELEFRNQDGDRIETQVVERKHPRPPWLGSTVGIKDRVLPSWVPMEVEDRSVRFWGRELVIGGSGLPEKIISQEDNLLARPVEVVAAAEGKALQWKSASQLPVIEKATETVVTTRGAMGAGNWQLETRITTEYDGLMKLESTLSGKAPGKVDSLRIVVPMTARNALLMGYWSGARNFRAATWHGVLPKKEGVVFASNSFKRARNKDLRGSFIPQLFLGGDERGLEWFAENDQGWNKSMEVPALEVVREGDVVSLRMNIIHQETAVESPRTFTFGLMATPVKALPGDFRSAGKVLNFGWCDSFSKQQLKSKGNYGNFNIYPEDYDWEAAKGRAEMHAFHYGRDRGYEGPFLYIDRNWVGLPPNAKEYGGIWYRSGQYRYTSRARDCYVWNIDQWLKHDLIEGIYIDDTWVGTFRDPATGPAYLMEDGKVQPGFEFFDYHELMKRLRWSFIDNGKRPKIWCHMTHTLFTPCLAFAEFLLDGEDRFMNWGAGWDFLDAWPAGRMRYNSGAKWGLIPVWFIKIGNDMPCPQPLPHWQYRQQRAYVAGTAANDIMAFGVPKEVYEEVYVDDARFVGYWSPDNPAKSDNPLVQVSTWRRKGHTVAMIVNRSKELLEEAALTIDAGKLGLGTLEPSEVTIEDIDRFEAPKGVDYTRVEAPKAPKATTELIAKTDDDDEFFDEVEVRDEQEEIEASGRFVYDDHNFTWKNGTLTLRIRPHDYRLLRFSARK